MKKAAVTNLAINYRKWLEDRVHMKMELDKLKRDKKFYQIKIDYYNRNPRAIKTMSEIFFYIDKR